MRRLLACRCSYSPQAAAARQLQAPGSRPCFMSRQARLEAGTGGAQPERRPPRTEELNLSAWAPFAGLSLDTALDDTAASGANSRTVLSPGSDVSDQQLTYRINLARANAVTNRKASKSPPGLGSRQQEPNSSRSQRYRTCPSASPEFHFCSAFRPFLCAASFNLHSCG